MIDRELLTEEIMTGKPEQLVYVKHGTESLAIWLSDGEAPDLSDLDEREFAVLRALMALAHERIQIELRRRETERVSAQLRGE